MQTSNLCKCGLSVAGRPIAPGITRYTCQCGEDWLVDTRASSRLKRYHLRMRRAERRVS